MANARYGERAIWRTRYGERVMANARFKEWVATIMLPCGYPMSGSLLRTIRQDETVTQISPYPIEDVGLDLDQSFR
jgi:hypothetical protein